MKTALQQLYEFMEQNRYFIGNDLYHKYQQLLETEREQIKNALFDGYWMSTVNALSQEDIEKGFPEYYKKTYGNESTSAN